MDKNTIVPNWPPITMAYNLTTGMFSHIIISDSVKLWRFFITSGTVRGGQKRLGSLTRGYYRFDISPPRITVIEEVTDVMMIVKKFKYTAVTLEIADVVLAYILVKNGVTVYNPALNPNVQPKGKKGVYSRGSEKSFIYRTCSQESPSLTKHGITMPLPVPITTNMPTYVVEHIPSVEENYTYLPSCRAAQGLCIKTNVGLSKRKAKELTDEELILDFSLVSYRKRFCKAIWYRNWFLITRYTFVSQDKYMSWFNTRWVYPRIKEEMDEDFFKNGEVVVGGDLDNLKEIDLSITEQNVVPDLVSIPKLSEQDQVLLLSLLDTYDKAKLEESIKLVESATMGVDHEVYSLYSHYSQQEFLQILHQLLSKYLPPPEQKQVAEELQPEMVIPDAPIEEEQAEDEDLFGDGVVRTVYSISDNAVKQEKE